MAYSLKNFDDRGSEVIDWLSREYSGIRTGRATPMLLDLVQVESYGSKVPINTIGSVNVEDPKTLRISVWDQGTVKAIEKAIKDADLGVSVVTDSSGLRVIFPSLTSERRSQLLKLAKSKLEEARVSLRGARDESMKQIDAQVKSGEMSEDERFKIKAELQKHIDAKNLALEEAYERKEKEING